MVSDIEKAMAKIRRETHRVSNELADLRRPAEVLPIGIRVQLNNAIEETHLLIFILQEATLSLVVHGKVVEPERTHR